MDIVPDASEPISSAQTVEDKTMTDAPLPIVKAESMVESAQVTSKAAFPTLSISLTYQLITKARRYGVCPSRSLDTLEDVLGRQVF